MARSELITHERYLGKIKTGTRAEEIRIGDVLTLMYKGEHNKKEIKRWVFVLNEDYENKAHLIDIDKISHLMLLQLVTKMKNDITPYDFYHKIIKHSFVEYQDAYRTYIINNMHSVERVDYNGLFSLAPIIKSNIYQTDNAIAVSYDSKGVNIPSNHPLLVRMQELCDKFGTFVDTKPNKKLIDFINRYKIGPAKTYRTDLLGSDIVQLREAVKKGGVFFVSLDSIKVLYASIENI